jgi:hypothetical protein
MRRKTRLKVHGKSRLQGYEKMYVGRLFTAYPLFGVLGAWITFKKTEMAKIIDTNPLKYKWLDFAI